MQRTFFFHIPKCAGMSVWHALWDIYGFKNVFQVGVKAQREEFDAMTAEQRGAYGAIGGHGVLPRLSKSAGDLSTYYKFVTFRDPIDRIVSEYHFIQRRPDHFLHETVSKIPLEEYAQRKGVINAQTRLMCGQGDSEQALAALDDFFDDWCLMEDLDGLIARLYTKMNKEPKSAGHENKRLEQTRQAEDPDVIAQVEALNAADIAFFRELQKRQAQTAGSVPTESAEKSARRLPTA